MKNLKRSPATQTVKRQRRVCDVSHPDAGAASGGAVVPACS